jgi:hypothetical protein
MAGEIERRLDRDRVRLDPQEIVGRLLLRVEPACPLHVSVAVAADHLRNLRPPEVRSDGHHADAAELEEGERVRVVAAVEIEPGLLGDEPRLLDIVVRLLDRYDILDLGEPRDGRRLDVDDDATGDVVGDHRQVRGPGDLLEVADDRPLGRLVVVRRHDEDRVDAELCRLLRQCCGVPRVVRAGTGDHLGATADLVHGYPEEIELLGVAQRRRLAGRPANDEPVRAVLDEERRELAEPVEVDCAVGTERRHHRGDHGAEHLSKSTRARPATPARRRRLPRRTSGRAGSCRGASRP